MRQRSLFLLSGLLVLTAACDGKGGDPDGGSATPPATYCPGQAGCENGGGESDALLAGAAAVTITPPAFEVPLPEYLRDEAALGQCDVGDRCGELIDIATRDCGADMLCRGDPTYTAPDADGTERDGVYDFFRDCGTDNVCPGDAGYVAPDADGTEGNGIFDGMWLAGFGNNRPATGVHDDLWARAAVLGKGDVKVAFVYLDLVGFFNSDVRKVREAVRQKRPEVFADLDFIQVGSTHVHEVPDTLGQWGLTPDVPGLGVPAAYKSGVNLVWLDYLIDRTADAIIEAYDAAVPATAAVATGRTGADGLVRDSRDPVIIDDTMGVLVLDDAASGDPIATLVNWGNHPEVLSDINNLITSDYSHYLREAVENGLPAEGSAPAVAGRGGICVYLQGPVGGLLTPLGTVGATTRDGTNRDAVRDWEKARAVGERLAEEALSLAASATPMSDTTIAFGAEELFLPMNNIFFQVMFGVGVFSNRQAYQADGSEWAGGLIDPDENFPWLKSETALFRIGNLSLLSVPGELFSEAAVGFDASYTPANKERIDPNNPNPPTLPTDPPPAYRERMGTEHTFVLGLSMDEVGYLVPSWTFELDPTSPYYEEAAGDHYEETNSLGPSTVPLLEEKLEILFQWQAAAAGE
ncbi:MAG: hypothetical protein P1V51_20400 [Deltaproteobacteria bacterium]|nr:hypothetical protein [Deltaproteobacteria bacterium]